MVGEEQYVVDCSSPLSWVLLAKEIREEENEE